MKSIWKGFLFRLYSATESQSLASHMLYKKDLSRIRFQRIAESTEKEVPTDGIVKGYEIEKNQYVILSDDELRNVSRAATIHLRCKSFFRARSSSVSRSGKKNNARLPSH